MLVVTLPSMVIHLKQNYISHLPPGLHDGWQGLQPKHPGLIASLFSVTNVTKKTYDTSRFPAVLNENMFVIGKRRLKKTKQTKKNHMGFCHTKNCKKQYSSIFCFLAPILFVVCVEVILPVLQRSVQLSHFDWFIIERERGRERENKGECTNCMNQVLLVFQLLHSMHTHKKVSMMSIQLVCTIQLQRWQAVQQVLSHHGSLTWSF